MKKTYQFRIYPNKNHEVMLNRILTLMGSVIPGFREDIDTIVSLIHNQVLT